MRRASAAISAVILGVAAVAHAADPADGAAATTQNPVVWLFSDIRDLFDPLVEDAPASAPAEQTKIAAPAPVKVTAPVPATAPAPAVTFENPLSVLFRDLASLFSGAAPTPEAVTLAKAEPDAVPAPIPAKTAEAAPQPAPAPVPAADAPAKASTNAISWLLSDIFGVFKAPSAPATDEQVETAAVAAPSPADEIAVPATETAATPKIEDQVVAGPWLANADGKIFDPGTLALSSDPNAPVAAPHTFVTAAAAPDTAQAKTDVQSKAAPAEPPLRVRAKPTADKWNFAALGSEQRAKAAAPVEENFFSNLLATFGIGYTSDETARPAPPVETAAKPDSKAPPAPAPVAAPAPAPASRPDEQSESLTNTVSSRIVPEEKLDLGYTSPDVDATRRTVEALSKDAVLDIDLVMGGKVLIGTAYDPEKLKKGDCVERPVHASVFCLEPMNWPREIAKKFTEDTAYTLPGEGVVRYENGRLSRAYAVFAAADFADVVKYMQRRFGPPTEREVVWLHMLESPEFPNTTFRWKAKSADRRDIIVLEVRNYDDQRRSFADLHHGMVSLYRDGSRPIFKHISTMDLMLLQRRRVAGTQADAVPAVKQP